MKKFPFENKYESIDEEKVSSIIREKNIRKGYIRINRNIVEVCKSCSKLNKIYALYCRGCKNTLAPNKNAFISETIDIESKEIIDLKNQEDKDFDNITKGDIYFINKDFILNILQSLIIISKIGQIQIINVLKNTNYFIDSISGLLNQNELICDVKTDMKYLYILTNKDIKYIPLYLFDLEDKFISNPAEQLKNDNKMIKVDNSIKSKISKNIKILNFFQEKKSVKELTYEANLFLIGLNEQFEMEYIIKDTNLTITNNILLKESIDFLPKLISYNFLDKLDLEKIKILFEKNLFNENILDLFFDDQNRLFLLKTNGLEVIDLSNKSNNSNFIELNVSEISKIITGIGVKNKILIFGKDRLSIIDVRNNLVYEKDRLSTIDEKNSLKKPFLIENNNLLPILYNINNNDIMIVLEKGKIKKYVLDENVSFEKDLHTNEININIDFIDVVSKKIVVIVGNRFFISR